MTQPRTGGPLTKPSVLKEELKLWIIKAREQAQQHGFNLTVVMEEALEEIGVSAVDIARDYLNADNVQQKIVKEVVQETVLKPPVKQLIRKERGTFHGDVEFGHTMLGKCWSALLSDHFQISLPNIPPHVVCLMLVQLKLLRAVRPFKFSLDDFVDAENYLDFAKENDPQNPDYKESKVVKNARTEKSFVFHEGVVRELTEDERHE